MFEQDLNELPSETVTESEVMNIVDMPEEWFKNE